MEEFFTANLPEYFVTLSLEKRDTINVNNMYFIELKFYENSSNKVYKAIVDLTILTRQLNISFELEKAEYILNTYKSNKEIPKDGIPFELKKIYEILKSCLEKGKVEITLTGFGRNFADDTKFARFYFYDTSLPEDINILLKNEKVAITNEKLIVQLIKSLHHNKVLENKCKELEDKYNKLEEKHNKMYEELKQKCVELDNNLLITERYLGLYRP